MRTFNIKKQLNNLYTFSALTGFHIAGASWVALLSLRGFSLAEIGVIEGIFHVVSLCFEIPSGAVADVMGRKRTLVASRIMCIVSIIFMIFSDSFASVAFAIGINALSYNLMSGTTQALAFDSMKSVDEESSYDKYAATEMMVYRISSSLATLCAGLSLFLGYKIAYSIDLVAEVICIFVVIQLKEVMLTKENDTDKKSIVNQFKTVFLESGRFLKNNPKAIAIIAINSVIGAFSTLLLFFLQAKLPMFGLNNALLGPALFLMGLGAALGAKVVQYFSNRKYGHIIIVSTIGVILAMATLVTKNPYIVILGGFIGSFSDDFLEVRTDVVLNNMIPSEQRATLISVYSFAFSIVMIVLSPVMGMILN